MSGMHQPGMNPQAGLSPQQLQAMYMAAAAALYPYYQQQGTPFGGPQMPGMPPMAPPMMGLHGLPGLPGGAGACARRAAGPRPARPESCLLAPPTGATPATHSELASAVDSPGLNLACRH